MFLLSIMQGTKPNWTAYGQRALSYGKLDDFETQLRIICIYTDLSNSMRHHVLQNLEFSVD
jgi:hypothetical protein